MIAPGGVRLDKKLICRTCLTLKDECAICGLPAHAKNRRRLDDGRFLCRLDKDGAVLDETAARQLYDQTKREIRSLLARWPPILGDNVSIPFCATNGKP